MLLSNLNHLKFFADAVELVGIEDPKGLVIRSDTGSQMTCRF